jgi:CRISPR-associated protein Cmr4
MRERHTRLPIIPGSSLKGVLADLWPDDYEKDDKGKWKRKKETVSSWLFGNESDSSASAGALILGEARLLCFPVRSAKNCFAWITCPLALNRFNRDAKKSVAVETFCADEDQKCYASKALVMQDCVVLEDYRLSLKREPDPAVAEALGRLLDDEIWASLKERLCIVSDEMFAFFAEHASEVVTRIKVDDETGTVVPGALFNLEQIPSETMFYAVVGAQKEKGSNSQGREAQDALAGLTKRIEDVGNVLQIGGDETVGLGYCTVEVKQ